MTKEKKITVFKDLYKTKDVPYIVTLEKILQRIKRGNDKELVNKIRQAKTKEERNQLKTNLPAILFQGEFSHRAILGLVKSSGLMVLDFDDINDDLELQETFETIKSNPFVVACFLSPSGNGYKAVINISENEASNYTNIFKQFKKEFDYKYFDLSTSDISRVCFSSYDPNIYINYDAKIYTPLIIDEGYEVVNKEPLLPIYDEDVIARKIMNFNFSKSFTEGERNAYIFDVAGLFCEYGVSQSYAIGYILNNVVIGDFSQREAEHAIKSAYKKRDFNIKFFEDNNLINNVKKDISKGKKIVAQKYKIDEETFDKISANLELVNFWTVKEDKQGNEKVSINPASFKLFLEMNGFKKYFPNQALKPIFVRIESNKVRETSIDKIKDFTLAYLMDRKELAVWNYCASNIKLFQENFLSMLDSIELLMLKDEKDKSFISFENGILEVTKDEIKLIDYLDVQGYVWENQIIKRTFEPTKETENDYKTFINNISNNKPLAMECCIGYLLSNYKNKTDNASVILNDEVISDNPEGGTGKGLFVQGLKQIRSVSILDGKAFDDKKSFAFQTVGHDTDILVFDDVKKNFNFENIFSLVTEGITLERKNKDAIKLSVEESPKILISTNYAIKGAGWSNDRRRHEVEFAQYYGRNITPFDEFKRQLFDDWSEKDFRNFDNYMIQCLQKYFQYGLISQDAKNIQLRKLIAESSMEFIEFIKDAENFPINVRHNKKEVFDQFIEEYIDFKKWLTRKKFNIWVKKYAEYADYNYEEGNTSGNRWFMLKTDEEEQFENLETPF